MKINYILKGFCLILLFIQGHHLHAQIDESSELFKELKKLDAKIFTKGFNECHLEDLTPIISEDLEFYHDVGGTTKTRQEFLKTLKQNICSNFQKKPIRKLIQNSLQVFPLFENGIIYGAIQNGSHEFYIKEPNKDLYLTGVAQFTHLWVIKDKAWLLKRVLSFDHKTPKIEVKQGIILMRDILNKYSGNYKNEKTEVNIIVKTNSLIMVSGDMKLLIYPEKNTLFFAKEAPLTFEFILNSDGKTEHMIVRENGKIVEKIKKIEN